MQVLSPASPFFFFFNDTATTEIYTLSLHDALPIYVFAVEAVDRLRQLGHDVLGVLIERTGGSLAALVGQLAASASGEVPTRGDVVRSEEHTSELQSHLNLVCRLLLEKKKKTHHTSD